MSDYLIELGKNATARKLVKTLGLPLPMPQELRRSDKPRQARPLVGRNVALWTLGGAMGQALTQALQGAGAQIHAPEGAGIDAAAALDPAGDQRLDALVFDATELQTPEELRALYDFFHPLMARIPRCGRVIVIGRPASQQKTAAANATQAALEGFMRSLAKEIGTKGATANLLYVAPDADTAAAGPLRFLLSPHAAYIDGQSLHITKPYGSSALLTSDWEASLTDKVALITGAARGIGEACARALAAEGAHVVCVDLPADEAATRALAEELGGTSFLADVSAPQTPVRLSRMLADQFEGLDIIVHNAGVTRDKTLKNMNAKNWDMTLDINLAAIERITRQLIEDKTLKTDGRIICLSSIAGVAGNLGQTNYSASKAGVIGLVDHWSRELLRRRITANAIAPGFIETRMTRAMPTTIRETARRLNNLRQGGQPEDIAQAVTFLATPQSQGVNGQVLRVCGGTLVGR